MKLALLLLTASVEGVVGAAAAATGKQLLRSSTRRLQLSEDRLCGCDCCQVVARTPDESSNGATSVKCAAAMTDASGSEVTSECDATNAQVLTNLLSKTAQTSQFCFLECKPYDVKIGTYCVLLSDAQQELARTGDGTGEDIHALPVTQEPVAARGTPAPPLDLPTEPDIQLKVLAPPAKESSEEHVLKEAADSRENEVTIQGAVDGLAAVVKPRADSAETRAVKVRTFVKEFDAQKAAEALQPAPPTTPPPAATVQTPGEAPAAAGSPAPASAME